MTAPIARSASARNRTLHTPRRKGRHRDRPHPRTRSPGDCRRHGQAPPSSTGWDRRGPARFRIAADRYHHQFCADLQADEAALMAATQRPVTERALTDGLTGEPAWRTIPSWFVFGGQDLNIPADAVRFMAERASSRGTRVVSDASHAIAASRPEEVVATIVDAVGEGQG
ncbi:alpha/beta fold hydrolase [Embleya sp. NPDC050493]|uniref:alpha/beta fold hydrolase n=1 Tax=Embleya sp. NPDC050493 TaxID=3363989 RepID=UPI0037A5E7AD